MSLNIEAIKFLNTSSQNIMMCFFYLCAVKNKHGQSNKYVREINHDDHSTNLIHYFSRIWLIFSSKTGPKLSE